MSVDYKKLFREIPEFLKVLGFENGYYDENNHDACVNLTLLPLQIRGFGHVKEDSIAKASKIRSKLIKIISGDCRDQKLSAAE